MASKNDVIIVGFLDADDDKTFDDGACELRLVTTHRNIKGVSTEDRYLTINVKKTNDINAKNIEVLPKDATVNDIPDGQLYDIRKSMIKNPLSQLEMEYGSLAEKRIAKVLSDKNLHKNDFLYVKGKIVTDNSSVQEVFCPNCDKKVNPMVYNSYIYPIFANKVNSGDWDDNNESRVIPRRVLATQWQEISNSVQLLGTVVWIDEGLRSIKNSKGDKEDVILNYLIRVDSAGDFMTPTLKSSNELSEHIVVRSFGAQALNDYKRLKIGSLVFVDGYARFIYDNVKCPQCHQKLNLPDGSPWETSQILVMAYKVEYLAAINPSEEELMSD